MAALPALVDLAGPVHWLGYSRPSLPFFLKTVIPANLTSNSLQHWQTPSDTPHSHSRKPDLIKWGPGGGWLWNYKYLETQEGAI